MPARRLEIYIQDAERAGDNELAEFFRRAQSESRISCSAGASPVIARLARRRRVQGIGVDADWRNI